MHVLTTQTIQQTTVPVLYASRDCGYKWWPRSGELLPGCGKIMRCEPLVELFPHQLCVCMPSSLTTANGPQRKLSAKALSSQPLTIGHLYPQPATSPHTHPRDKDHCFWPPWWYWSEERYNVWMAFCVPRNSSWRVSYKWGENSEIKDRMKMTKRLEGHVCNFSSLFEMLLKWRKVVLELLLYKEYWPLGRCPSVHLYLCN